MTSKDFINWLRGYIAGNDGMSTKVKNDLTKALDSVKDDTTPTYSYRIGTGGIGVVNTTADGTTTYNTDVPTTKTI